MLNKRSIPSHTAPNLCLAFGQRYATINHDIRALYDLITGVTPTLKSYEHTGTDEFYHRSALVNLKDLSLAATVCSPMAYEVCEDTNDTLYFILPFHGQASARTRRKDFLSNPALGAAITPGHDRKGHMGEISMLQATLRPERLKATALAMLGQSSLNQVRERFLEPRVLPMHSGQVRFDHLFSTICRTIDDCGMQSALLHALGFDDLFYRSVVTMAFPELLAQHSTATSAAALTPLNRVCDYIDAHLSEAIYLTELEAVAGLGTRALQYAFMRRFGCSPTAWIRQRRLQLAHQRLMHAGPSDTVTGIALDCGFSNPGDFAQLYQKSYGEPPRQVLKRSKSR